MCLDVVRHRVAGQFGRRVCSLDLELMSATDSAPFAGKDSLPAAVEKQVRVIGALSSNVRCLRFAFGLRCEGSCLAVKRQPAGVLVDIEEREPSAKTEFCGVEVSA
jgi:hypothetical protein